MVLFSAYNYLGPLTALPHMTLTIQRVAACRTSSDIWMMV